MGRGLKASAAGFLLVAVAALVVVAGGAAKAPEGDGGRVRIAGEADRLRLEPAGLHRREEGGSGHRCQGARRDRCGLRERRAEPQAAGPARRGPDHRARVRLQRGRPDDRAAVQRARGRLGCEGGRRQEGARLERDHEGAGRRVPRGRPRRADDEDRARSGSSSRRPTRTGSSSRAATARAHAR